MRIAQRCKAAAWVGSLIFGIFSALGFAADAPEARVTAFRAECAARAAEADKSSAMTVVGKGGWLFLAAELRHLSVGPFWGENAAKVSRADRPDRADPLPAILDFKAQLDKAGVELILLPVPAKAIIYPEMLSSGAAGETGRLDTAHEQFYEALRKSGINVIDLTADLLAHKGDKAGVVFCKQDTHWSGYACELAAQRIAREIASRPWLKAAPKLSLASETRTVEINGDLRQALADKPAAEQLALRFVGAKNGGLAPVEPSRDSPILLLGDSHTLIFHSGGDDMLAKGAGLADQLALETGIAIDVIGVRGSGATPARVNLLREVRKNPDYLPKKKLIIWCFTAREFTEGSGWANVPIVK